MKSWSAIILYDAMIKEVARLHRHAAEVKISADLLEQRTWKLFDLEYIEREPGFPGWRFREGDTGGWFASPYDAIKCRYGERPGESA